MLHILHISKIVNKLRHSYIQAHFFLESRLFTITSTPPHSPLPQEQINTSDHNAEEEDKDEGTDDNFCNI